MVRLFTLIVGGICIWYLYTSGLGVAILNGNTPISGTECTAVGPKYGHAYFSEVKSEMRWPFDASIGFNSKDRQGAEGVLKSKVEEGSIKQIADGTKIRVLAMDKIMIYSCPYHIVKVDILSGRQKGHRGWMMREDVIDNPMQKFIQQYFRVGTKKLNQEMDSVDTHHIQTKWD